MVSWSNPQKLIILKAVQKPLRLLSSIHLNLLNHCLRPDLLGIWLILRYNLRLRYYLVPTCTIVYTWMKVVFVRNKCLCHERLCPENKVLHLMFYYELKLYWMKICWLYEGPWIIFSTFVLKKNISNHLRIHCGYLEIETIVRLSFLSPYKWILSCK
jgi:hypothetical protein